MCLILFAYKKHPSYKLILAANRDEFYARPTQAAAYWTEYPEILAGKDIEAGGTWMGINKVNGKICMLTNYRDPANIKASAPSRGLLVSNFLKEMADAPQYVGKLGSGTEYNGFNMVLGDYENLWYYSNQFKGLKKLPAGVYGLSNHLLNTEWPKVIKGKQKLNAIMDTSSINYENLFEALYDNETALDHQLPDTGVGLEKERLLSPMFIKSPIYGSRCSTVLLIDNKNNFTFAERTYNTDTFEHADQVYQLKLS